jgi:hypothetical protein
LWIISIGQEINFTEDGWFNATEVAAKFGKRPVDWLNLPSTKEYLAALMEDGQSEKISLWVKTSRGGNNPGTWMHPKLGVPFSRWLDLRFSVWCDKQIDNLIRNKHPHFDHVRLRHEAAATFKVMQAMLQYSRQESGKLTQSYHYINEALLVNWALSGERKSLDRDSMTSGDLHVLAKLEERNAVLIGRGVQYQDRKKMLEQFALDLRTEQTLRLAA